VKRILKYVLYLILLVLFVSLIIIFTVYIRYHSTVRTETGKLEVPVKPGEPGKWVNPFIGTGGFPGYIRGDDIPGPTMPFGMVRFSRDSGFFHETKCLGYCNFNRV